MWQRLLAVVAVSLIASQGKTEGVKVHATGALVDVEARGAALSDVLAQLAEATGMRVVYEGPPPRQRITVSLKQRTPADAVAGILEGLGLSYGLTIDDKGGRVQTLVLSASRTTPAPAGRLRMPRPMTAESDEMPRLIDPEGPDPATADELSPGLNPEMPRFPDSASMPEPEEIPDPPE
jgi:hypothetical protein